MRDRRRFFILTIVILVIAMMKFHFDVDRMEEVDTFRGANIQKEVFHPLIAQSVNKIGLTANLNGQIYTSEDGIYMSDNLSIMVPARLLMEGLDCATHLYDETTLIIRQVDNEICMDVDSRVMMVNGSLVEITDVMVVKDEEAYVPLQQLERYLNFVLTWDVNTNIAVGTTTLEGSFIPSAYDLRDGERLGITKDQGKYGTCWAFAALSAIESTLLPEEKMELSPEHMALRNSFSTDLDAGGQYSMGMAYLTSWQGPVTEAEDAYGDGESPEGLRAVKHVQEVQILQSKDYEAIKEAVFKYGAVQTSIYMKLWSKTRTSTYYDAETYSYYYNGQQEVNHDILIIGWDDSYSRENFTIEPERDGAFLCLNSWGEEFGDCGVFWVSYDDVNVGTRNISYTKVEDPDNYDSIYQSDLCGWSAQLGFGRSEIYAASVYTAYDSEVLEAVGFYATDVNTSYEIYGVEEFVDVHSLKNGILLATGTKSQAGYYTIELDKELELTEGKKFAIIIKINTPSSKLPLAVEYAEPGGDLVVDLTDGESYISTSGMIWERAEDTKQCNVCLKAYTRKR